MARLQPVRPLPRFDIQQIVKTPVEVCECQQAKVVGREWGPDNRFTAGGGWVYLIQFFEKDPRPEVNHLWPTNTTFLATEEELVRWSA